MAGQVRIVCCQRAEFERQFSAARNVQQDRSIVVDQAGITVTSQILQILSPGSFGLHSTECARFRPDGHPRSREHQLALPDHL